MSTTVDNRVVNLQLKNSQFEKNAEKTVQTLTKLKTALEFNNVGKGFDQIEKSANNVKFDRLASSIESIQSKFSALNIAAMTVLQNIVNKAVNAGMKIANALTIEPITSGFNEYEQKIGSIQTILANTVQRQKDVSQQAIQAINDEADAAVKKNQELNEVAIENLQEVQAAQDRALQKSFQAQSKAYEKQASEQMKAYEKQASARLEAFQKETEQEVEALNDSYEQRFDALEDEQDKELEAAQQLYDEKYKALVAAQKEETKALEKSYKEQTKAYEKEIKNQNKALQSRFDEETKALEKAADDQLDVLEDQQSAELKALEKTQKAELSAVEDRYDEQLKVVEDAADKELDALQDAYDEQVEALTDAYDEQLEALEDYYDEAYDALEKSQRKETELLEKDHDARLDMYHEEYMEKLKVADEERYNKIKALDKEIDSIKGLEEAEKEERKEAENRRKLQELEAAVQNAGSETERLRAESKLAEFRDKLAKEAAEKEKEARIEALEAEKDAINEEYDLKKDQIKEEYELQKNNEDELYKQQKQDLSDLQKQEKKALQDQEEEEKKALKKSTEEQKKIIKEQYDYEKELAQERQKLQKEQLQEQKEAEKEALKEQQETAKEILKDQQEDQKEALKEQTQAQKDALKEQQDLQKEALQEQQELQKEALQETYETQKEALQEQQELQKEGLRTQNEQEKQAIQEAFDARKERLSEQQESEMNALEERRQKEQEAIEERNDKEREALQDRIDAGRDALKDSQDARQRALDSRQKAELEAMKERHEQELQNIEIEKNAKLSNLQKEAGMTDPTSLEDVNKALDELNDYADKTIYNFADMTHNIGTFTAAGVDLDTSVDAIKGIANLAALSGTNAEKASVAMYQLSQAIASGAVKYEDWSSVVTAGMSGKQFQEALKETARVHGVNVDEMIAKEGSFQLSLHEGWLTSEVLLETLSKFTGDLTDEQLKSMGYTEEQVEHIQEVAQNAVDAATKVRTFSQLIDTTKEALGSGWTDTFELIFGDFNEATELWTGVSEIIDKVISKQADARNQLLSGWKEGGGRDDLIASVKNVWDALVSIIDPIKKAFTNIFPPATSQLLIDITEKIKDFTSKLTISDKTSKNLRRTFKGLFSVVKLVGDVFGSFLTAISPVGDIIGAVASHFLQATGDVGMFITKIVKATEENETFSRIAGGIKGVLETVIGTAGDVLGKLYEPFEKIRKIILDVAADIVSWALDIDGPIGDIGSLFDTVGKKAKDLMTTVKTWFTTRFGKIDTSFLTSFGDTWSDIKLKIIQNGGLKKIIGEQVDKIKEYGETLSDRFSGVTDVVKKFSSAIKGFATKNFDVIVNWFKNVPKNAKAAQDKIKEFAKVITDWVKTKIKAPDLSFLTDTYEAIKSAIDPSKSKLENFKAIFDSIKSKLAEVVPDIGSKVKEFGGYLKDLGGDLAEKVTGGLNTFVDWCKSIPEKVGEVKDSIASLIDSVKEWGRQHFKAPDFGFITDFFDLITGKKFDVGKTVKAASESVETISASFDSGEVSGMKSSVTSLVDFIKDKIDWINENISFDDVLVNLGKVTALLAGGGVTSVITSFARIEKSINKVLKGFKNIGKSITGITNEFKNTVTNINDVISGFKDNAKTVTDAFAGTVKTFDQVPKSISGVFDQLKESIGMIGKTRKIDTLGKIAKNILILAASVGIMALAIKSISDIDSNKLQIAIMGLSGMVLALGGTALALSKYGGEAKTNSLAILSLATSVVILSKVVAKLGEMETEQVVQGGVAALSSLAGLAAAAGWIGDSDFNMNAGTALLEMATSLLIVEKAVKLFGKIDTEQLVKGGIAVATAIGALTLAMRYSNVKESGFNASAGLGLIEMASALIILQKALEEFGKMNFWDDVIPGLAAMGGALGELVVGLNKVKGTVESAEALGIVAVAMYPLAKAFSMFAELSLGEIASGLVAMGTAIGTLVGGAYLVSQFSDGMKSLALGLAAFGLVAIGIAAALSAIIAAIGTLATISATSLGAVVTAFGFLASGILDVLITLTPKVATFIGELIEAALKVMVGKKVAMFEAGMELLIGVLDALIEHGNELIDKMAQVIFMILDGLQLYGPDIVEKAVALAVSLFAAIIDGINQQNIDVLTNAVEAISFIAALMAACAGLSALAPSAMAGLAELGVFIGELTAIIGVIGGIAQIPGFMWLMDEGGKALEAIGTAIGKFFGGITGGIMEGITSSLPNVGQSLTDFMKNAKYFFNQVGKITENHKTGAGYLTSIIIGLTGASLLDAMANIISNGQNRYSALGKELTTFATTAKPFFNQMKKLGTDGAAALTGVQSLASALMTLTKQKILDGLTSWFSGKASFASFGEELAALGPSLKTFATETEGINGSSVEGSANALDILSKAAKSVPKRGGKIAEWLTGENSLATFGEELEVLGPSLKKYAESVAGIDSDSVESSANAVKCLARVAKIIPYRGGKIAQWFFGENSMETFGGEIEKFGGSLATYADAVKDISAQKVKCSANAAQALADLANGLPESGGFIQAFLGEQSLGDFGSDLEAFGESLATYAGKVEGIGDDAITGSAAAAATMVALANDLPESKGLFGKLFGGEKSLEKFGGNLEAFGTSILNYYNTVKEIPLTNNLVGIGTVASKMVDVASSVQNIEIKDLKTFGGYIADLGDGEKDYYDAVSGIDFTQVSTAIYQATRLASLGETLKDLDSDSFEKFNDAMESLADAGISGFVDAFKNAEEDCLSAVTKLIDAVAKGMVDRKDGMTSNGEELGKTIPDGMITGIGSKGPDLATAIDNTTGAILLTFQNDLPKSTFEKIGKDCMTGITTGFGSDGANTIQKINLVTKGVISTISEDLDQKSFTAIGKGMISAISTGMTDVTTNARLKINATAAAKNITDAFRTQLSFNNVNGIGVNAINYLTRGISGESSSVNLAASRVASGARTSFANNITYNQMKDVGVNAINGFILGIQNGQYYVNKAVAAVATGSLNTWKNAYNINSPSKETEEIGGYLDEGLAIGITSNAKTVNNAIENLADGTSERVGDIVGDVETSVDNSKKAMQTTGEDVDAFNQKIDAITETVNIFRDSVNNSNDILSTLDTTINNTNMILQTLATNFSNVTNELERYTEQQQLLTDGMDALIKVMSTAESNMSQMTSTVSSLTSTFENLSESIGTATQALSEYDRTYSSSSYSKPSTSVPSYSDTSGPVTYEDMADLLGSSGSGYSGYGSSSGSIDYDDMQGLFSDSADIIADEITDAMREQPVDMEIDLSSGSTKNKNKKKKNGLDLVGEAGMTVDKSGDGITALGKAMTYGSSASAISLVNSELKETKKLQAEQKAQEEANTAKILKAVESNSKNKETSIENNNVFNIRSTDPKQSAAEVGRILQKQYDRGKAVWAL